MLGELDCSQSGTAARPRWIATPVRIVSVGFPGKPGTALDQKINLTSCLKRSLPFVVIIRTGELCLGAFEEKGCMQTNTQMAINAT
jgi:hypothetical protein